MPITIDNRVKKKNGVYRYRVRVNYTDTNGKTQQVERLVWGKAEAEIVERQLELEYKDKKQVKSSKMTVAELFDKFSEYHASETRQTSHKSVMKELRLRVLPYLKEQKITNLNQSVLADWKITIDKLNLALRTKQNTYKAFASMLNYAVKMEFIQKNYLKTLGNFKDKGYLKDNLALKNPTGKLRYYTTEQFEKFISAMKADCNTIKDWDYYVFFCIAFFTGARKGEIHALKWSDIKGNIMHIRRSITQKIKGGDIETAPKNKSSIRDLQIPEPLLQALAEQKERQKNLSGERFSEDLRVCGCTRPLRDSTIDNQNRKYAEKAGLPHITIHEFRHSHASLLANEGINIQEISRRLGHATVQETWNRYSHLYPREEERALNILNKVHI